MIRPNSPADSQSPNPTAVKHRIRGRHRQFFGMQSLLCFPRGEYPDYPFQLQHLDVYCRNNGIPRREDHEREVAVLVKPQNLPPNVHKLEEFGRYRTVHACTLDPPSQRRWRTDRAFLDIVKNMEDSSVFSVVTIPRSIDTAIIIRCNDSGGEDIMVPAALLEHKRRISQMENTRSHDDGVVYDVMMGIREILEGDATNEEKLELLESIVPICDGISSGMECAEAALKQYRKEQYEFTF